MKKLIALLVVALLSIAMVCTLVACDDSDGSDEPFYAVSLGWMENASGQRQKVAFETMFAEYGITNYSITDANYDAAVQTQQIEAFIALDPVVLFITASDPISISDAVAKAADAGIPVFSSDALIPGAEVVTSAMFDNFAGGYETMKILADTLIETYPDAEEIEIGMITLPSNDAWAMREYGADSLLASDSKYDVITVKYEWPWDSTGAVTPTNTISSWIAADTSKNLKGIWCAWDGAAFEGLVVTATDRPEILYVGSDGGEDCFNMMLTYPDQFIATLGESVWAMPSSLVDYAMTYLNGGGVPRLVIVPGYLITSEMIENVDAIKDQTTTVNGVTMTAWELLLDYDLTGYTDALNDLLVANGYAADWVATV